MVKYGFTCKNTKNSKLVERTNGKYSTKKVTSNFVKHLIGKVVEGNLQSENLSNNMSQ